MGGQEKRRMSYKKIAKTRGWDPSKTSLKEKYVKYTWNNNQRWDFVKNGRIRLDRQNADYLGNKAIKYAGEKWTQQFFTLI